MSVPAAYLGVIIIWTTTPLAIKWSGEGSHFLFALTARMAIAAVLSLILLRATGASFPWHRKARANYFAVGFSLYGVMTLVYWGAQYIPSGLISLIFGLAPIATALLATLLLGENNLTPVKLFSMAMGLGGLMMVFSDSALGGRQTSLGIAAVVAAMLLHCISAVWIKQIDADIPALASTAGGVIVATFLLQSTWIALDVRMPGQISSKAIGSIIYLGLAGSVLGFSLYYYLLKHSEATKVALITLITPVSSLLLGNWLNAEALSASVITGASIILSGLVLFQFGEGWLRWAKKVAINT
ncbi:MAG: DMT family transporter [Desulfuromonadales bacterium]|nr:DMT family transporter [Desulfuromonadales bacterium]